MLNALYALCKIFLECHTSGTQTLTNVIMQLKYLIVGIVSSVSERGCNIKGKKKIKEYNIEGAFK